MTFLTKTVAERTKPNVPEQVSEDKYKVKAHVFRTSSQPGKPGLAGEYLASSYVGHNCRGQAEGKQGGCDRVFRHETHRIKKNAC